MNASDRELASIAENMDIDLVGIFSKDQLPDECENGGYIINMEDNTDSNGNLNNGTHWVALWVNHNTAVYFDSFGIAPPAEVLLFCNHLHMIINDQQIQNERSGWCGYYCLIFLFYMNHHKHLLPKQRLLKFLKFWHFDVEKNLMVLHNFFRHHKSFKA